MTLLRQKHAYREHEIQCAIHGWLEQTYECEVVAVPNGGFRGQLEAKRLKDEGVQAGHPDLIAYAAGGTVKLIEVKTDKGTLTDSQKRFLPRLGLLGFDVLVARSLDDVKAAAPAWGFPARREIARIDAGGF